MIKTDTVKIIETLYIPLLEAFLRNDLTAEEFVEIYLEKRFEDRTKSHTRETHTILQSIFEDIDAYDSDPDPANWPFEIGEDELRRCCTENLAKLKAFVQEYEAQS